MLFEIDENKLFLWKNRKTEEKFWKNFEIKFSIKIWRDFTLESNIFVALFLLLNLHLKWITLQYKRICH